MKLKENLYFVRCECGEEILLLSDLEAMDMALENHVSVHVKNQPDRKRANEEAKRIRELLTKRVVEKIAEIESKV